jgi:hypothetical protein
MMNGPATGPEVTNTIQPNSTPVALRPLHLNQPLSYGERWPAASGDGPPWRWLRARFSLSALQGKLVRIRFSTWQSSTEITWQRLLRCWDVVQKTYKTISIRILIGLSNS